MSLENVLQQKLKSYRISLTSVGGGDINDAYRVETGQSKYFLKYNDVAWAEQMFKAEKKGLLLLKQAGLIVPEPLDIVEDKNHFGLLLEWKEKGRSKKDSWIMFGRDLAKLHKTYGENHGLDHDNFIGRLPQSNLFDKNWLNFYASRRIEPQLKIAVDNGLMPTKFVRTAENAIRFFGTGLPDVSPSLLHGDLWSGNLMFDEDSQPVFIDPAIYFGHREMDIAMMKLFGGFDTGLEHYNEIFPLQAGWMERLQFYQLYYILVHVNLFGGSYTGSASRILTYYGERK
jgi:fructosamine-3-kinase